ncbi:MAG: cupin [Solirubrobacterales bacterium]|nr:cupin [Solirubrobacterales bacterium]
MTPESPRRLAIVAGHPTSPHTGYSAGMTAARGTVSVDNDRVRVTTWTFEGPGAATGQHRHEFDYIVVPITGGTFTVTDVDGCEGEINQVAGMPYLGTAGTAHDVVSGADERAVFVEIELKR